VLTILIQRRGADAPQLTARQRRLKQIARVHRALGLAGANHGVNLVYEQNDLTLGLLDLNTRVGGGRW
jgi:hypothetical protein